MIHVKIGEVIMWKYLSRIKGISLLLLSFVAYFVLVIGENVAEFGLEIAYKVVRGIEYIKFRLEIWWW